MANKRKADDWYKVVNKRAEDVVLNLPVDRDAERAVLGGLMMGAVHFSDVHEYLDSEDFFGEAHQTLFELLVGLIKKGEATDLVSVLHHATHQEKSEKIGGHEYITELYTSSSTAYNIDFHASIVKDLATRRKLMHNANVIIQAAQTGLATIDDVLELAEKKVFEITQSAESKDWQSIEKVVGQEFERIQALMEISSDVTGMDTGFTDLNKIFIWSTKDGLGYSGCQTGNG